MTYIAAKLAELRAEMSRLRTLALAITDLPNLTPLDREKYVEYLELIYEIEDYIARLQRPRERWKA
jgi:hypothetical protein